MVPKKVKRISKSKDANLADTTKESAKMDSRSHHLDTTSGMPHNYHLKIHFVIQTCS